MLVGISYCLRAQPDPYSYIQLKFVFEQAGKQTNLWFPHFKSLPPDTAKIQSIAAQDLSRRFMLVANSPYPNLHYAFTGYNIRSKKYIHELNLEWNNESTTVDLFLFPIPLEQRGQDTIKISSYYVMRIHLKLYEINKFKQTHHHYNFLVPYQSGSYKLNFFNLDNDSDQESPITKHWKPQKHPTKMYTFRVR